MEIVLRANQEGEHAIAQHFDIDLGYRSYYEKVKASFSRKEMCGPCELVDRGMVKFENIFSLDRCAELIEETDGHLENWSETSSKEVKIIMSILEKIITPEVDKNIISFFESEYVPTVIGFSRTEAGTDDVSSRWHFDAGPEKHLILIVGADPDNYLK